MLTQGKPEQSGPFKKFHGDIGRIAVFPGIVDGDDMGMGERTRTLRFPEELSLDLLNVFFGKGFLKMNRFNGRKSVDIGIAPQKDLTHSPFTDGSNDLVATDGLAVFRPMAVIDFGRMVIGLRGAEKTIF